MVVGLLPGPESLRAEVAKLEVVQCGATPREAIAEAEKALAGKTAFHNERALRCVLAALKALEAARLDVVQGTDRTRFLNVPRAP